MALCKEQFLLRSCHLEEINHSKKTKTLTSGLQYSESDGVLQDYVCFSSRNGPFSHLFRRSPCWFLGSGRILMALRERGPPLSPPSWALAFCVWFNSHASRVLLHQRLTLHLLCLTWERSGIFPLPPSQCVILTVTPPWLSPGHMV